MKRSDSVQPLEQILKFGIKVLSTLDQPHIPQQDVVVIASPSSLHLADVINTISVTNSLLIEKPITTSVRDAIILQDILLENSKKAGVGYHMRFSETVMALRTILADLNYGFIHSISLQYSQKLSLWRSGVDPTKSVTAKAELGGGVLLELSHEIDALQFLVGPIKKVLTSEMRFDGAPTDGAVDTLVTFSGTCAKDTRFQIHLDMLGSPPKRIWDFNFEKVTIRADLLSGEIIQLSERDGSTFIHRSRKDERDSAEKNMLTSFLKSSSSLPDEFCTLSQATTVMQVIESVKESFQKNQAVNLSIK